VECVRHLAAAGDHAENLGTARRRVVEALEHQRAGPFGCKRRSKNPSLEATEWFGSSPE
jgi:hypothetical protein